MQSFDLIYVQQPVDPRLPLVGEITYNRGNEEFVGGRGNLRGKGCKIGEMLENVRELNRNCLIENRIKIKDQLYSTKLQNKFQMGASSYQYKYRLLKTVFRLSVISLLSIETWHAT